MKNQGLYQYIYSIIQNRSLLFAFAVNDFRRRFSGSVFGVFWAFAQPLLTVLIYWFAFEFGFPSGPIDGTPFVLWFVAAIVPWLFIAEAITVSSNCFIEYSYLVKKVVFNIDILPLVKIVSSLLIHVVFLVLVGIIYVLFGFYPTFKIFQLAYYVCCSTFFVFVLSLFFSSIMVFFRDLNQFISLLLLIGMWGSPIAWNISRFPDSIQRVLRVNPVYYLIEGYRDAYIGRAWFYEKGPDTILFWSIMLIMFCFGVAFYRRLKPHFADVL